MNKFSRIRVLMYCPNTEPNKNSLPNTALDRARFFLEEILKPTGDYLEEQKDSADVLRIFVGPEYMFRGNGKAEPYTISEKDAVIQQLVLATSGNESLRNFLLIPGTICWGDRRSPPTFDTDSPNFNWFNTVPIISEGQLIHTYDKQHDSDNFGGPYDGLTVEKPSIITSSIGSTSFREVDVGLTGGNAEGFNKWKANTNQRMHPSTSARAPFFNFQGLSCCVEICADFGGATAMRMYMDGAGVDLHIVPSWGIIPGSPGSELSKSVVRSGGYLLICNSKPNSDIALRNMTALYNATYRSPQTDARASALLRTSAIDYLVRNHTNTIRGVKFPANLPAGGCNETQITRVWLNKKSNNRNYLLIDFGLKDLPQSSIGSSWTI